MPRKLKGMTDYRRLKKQQTCLLHISSEYKHRGTDNGDFSVILGNSIKVKETVKVVPLSLTIPNVFPNIGPHNNKMEALFGGLSGWKTLTIPEGQYSDTQLALALTNAFADLYPTIEESVDFQIVNAHLTVNNLYTRDLGIRPVRGDLTRTDSLFAILGLLAKVQADMADGSSIPYFILKRNRQLTIEYPVNLAPFQSVSVHSSVLAPNNAISSDGRSHNCITVVDFSDTPYGGTVCKQLYDSEAADTEYRTALELDDIDIRLTDIMNRPLSLPSNFHVHLLLRVYYGHNHK